MQKIVFYTLGCKLNQYETEGIASAFVKKSFSVAEYPECGDIYIINTCTVTSKSEQKARRIIRKISRENPGKPIIVTGCYTQLDKQEVSSLAKEVIPVPLSEKHILLSLPELINKDSSLQTIEKIISSIAEKDTSAEKTSTSDYKKKSDAGSETKDTNNLRALDAEQAKKEDSRFFYEFSQPAFHTRAYVKIQDGCNHKCSYCRVTLARGPSVSLSPQTVIKRVTELEKQGTQEIILTGVNIAQYRHTGYDLGKLLLKILDSTNNIRIRLSSFENEAISDSFIQALEHPRICPHFHISLQSGSAKILKAMRRWYSPEDIKELAKLFRQKKDKPFISGDVIVGFPGETDEDFADTLSLIEELSFSDLHIFRYSQRPGTDAYSLKPQIPQRIAAEREKELRKMIKKLSHTYISEQKNRKVRIIRESQLVVNNKTYISGITENYLTALIPDDLCPHDLPAIEAKITEPCPTRERSVFAIPLTQKK